MKKYKWKALLSWILIFTMIFSNAAFAGTWEKQGTNWSYRENGEQKTGWIKENENWYYFNDSGIMQTGWIQQDNKWYFLNTLHDGFFGKALTGGWQWIDGYCYRFNSDGQMYANCTTPDGFTVNANGQWTVNGVAQYKPGIGLTSVLQQQNSSDSDDSADTKDEVAEPDTKPDPDPDVKPDPSPTPDPGPTPPTPDPDTPAGDPVKFTQTSMTLEPGMSRRLETTSSLTNLNWSSSNPAIASVSPVGTVTAHTAGTVSITASNADSSDSCQVTVTEDVLSLSSDSLVLSLYQEQKLSLLGTSQTPVWESSDPLIVSVDENGTVQALSAGMATIRAAVEGRSASCTVRVCAVDLNEDSTVVTRGEWIKELLEAAEYDSDMMDDDSIIWHYSDTEADDEYGKLIEYAYVCGILPKEVDEQDVPAFASNQPATREFASFTGAHALQFSVNDIESLACADQGSLKYKKEDYIAVQNAFLFLDENNRFCPNEALTSSEKEQFLSAVISIKNTEAALKEIAPGEILREEVTYTPDTISPEQLSDVTYEITRSRGTSGSLELSMTTPAGLIIQPGNNLVLPASDEYPQDLPFYVESVEKQEDGSLLIGGHIQDDITQIVDRLRFTGAGEFLPQNAECLLDEAEMTYDPDDSIDTLDDINYYGARFSTSVPGKLKFDFGDGVKLNRYAKLEGSLTVEIPDVTLDTDFNLSSILDSSVTVSLTEKMKLEGGLKVTVADSASLPNSTGSIELARLPFALGATGLSADIVVSLYYDVNGTCKLIYTLRATEGFEYKNRFPRYIGNVIQNIEIPHLEGKAEVGTKFALNLVFCEIWDVIGGDFKVGPAATASANYHPNINLACLDASLYLSGKIELNPETLIGELLKKQLHYTLDHTLWKSENSPFKIKYHYENGVRVEECTASRGDIQGRVLTTDGSPLSNARVILKSGDLEIAYRYTNSSGRYNFDNIIKGDYTLIVSADAYQTFSNDIHVKSGQLNQMEDIFMVRRNVVGQGKVYGSIKNATNLNLIDSVHCEVYSGWGNTSGNPVYSGDFEKQYELFLNPGNYTIRFTADQYSSTTMNVAVNAEESLQKDVLMSPAFSPDATSMRVVLEWGEYPRDLDSHMFGSTADGALFHTYYANKREGDTWLDVDDTTSYGPETTTVNKIHPGVYSYYVHDFTNRISNNTEELSNSDARVTVYLGNSLYTTLYIPIEQGGTVWHVFDYDSTTGDFTVVNTMSYSSDPWSLTSGISLYDFDGFPEISEEEALEIFNEIAMEGEKEDSIPIASPSDAVLEEVEKDLETPDADVIDAEPEEKEASERADQVDNTEKDSDKNCEIDSSETNSGENDEMDDPKEDIGKNEETGDSDTDIGKNEETDDSDTDAGDLDADHGKNDETDDSDTDAGKNEETAEADTPENNTDQTISGKFDTETAGLPEEKQEEDES